MDRLEGEKEALTLSGRQADVNNKQGPELFCVSLMDVGSERVGWWGWWRAFVYSRLTSLSLCY